MFNKLYLFLLIFKHSKLFTNVIFTCSLKIYKLQKQIKLYKKYK